MKILERFAEASVLVIDDTPANTELLRAVLSRAGLRNISSYTDPRQAIAQLELIAPDLVLVDLHMPHLDGYAVLEHLLAHAAGAYLPALMLTADTTPQAIRRALSCGARDFLTKPFETTEVALRVRNLLETRDLHQQLRRHNRWLRAELTHYRRAAHEDPTLFAVEHQRITRAIDQQELHCVFQPVFDLSCGAIIGVEALARFPAEPRRGPDLWFAEATRVGLGVELEILAVRTALEALRRLPEPLFLAVNVSPAALLSGRLGLDQIPAGCTEQAWRRVVLELTEHAPVEDYDALRTATAGLRARGVRLAADDAGAGYAGFRHLLGLRPDIIKCDLSLTRDIDTDPTRRALTSALVQFTRDTAANLIAEGVETAAELDALRRLHVPWAQGYHLARPQPLHEILTAAKNAGS